MKTFGTLTHQPATELTAGRGGWLIDSEPHVTIKVKRLFPRAAQSRSGTVTLVDTPEVARDIEWLMTRWPLNVDQVSLDRLTGRAQEHRDTETAVQRILAGHVPNNLWREPARPPRAYQAEAAALIHQTGRLLVLDELGLGKTFTALLALRDPEALPALVVTLTHLPRQWLDELQESLPWLTGHVLTKSTPYDPMEHRGIHTAPDVLVCNYAKLDGWADHLAGTVRTVIFDEIQELRHDGSNKYNAAAMIADKAKYRIGLSATPVYNYGGELFNIASVLDRDALGSHTEFLREWGGGYSSNGHSSVKDPRALGTHLRDIGLAVRRTRVEVGRELPDVVPVVHTVASDEHTLHEAIERDGIAGFAELVLASSTSREDRFRAAGELDWKLRRATGLAKASYVAQFVRLLLESEQRVVLFGWHRDVYDIWLDELAAFKPRLYTGSESPTGKLSAAKEFVEGDCRVLIMSLRAGAGLDGLQEATRVAVFGELDWSPGVHAQCIGRLHRDGQTDSVLAYYLVSEEGSDPVVLDVLGVKRRQSEPIVDPYANLAPTPVDTSDRIRRLAADLVGRRP